MNRFPRRLAIAGLAAGLVATAWRTALSRQDRRRMLERGKIAELHSKWFDVNGCRIHARMSVPAASHSAAPVILIHGWGVSGAYFVPAAEHLASDLRVLVPDLPGHGLSDTPKKALDIPELAQVLVDWMDRAGIARASLVGQSMGCQVAVEAAVRHPERVDSLVLIGPAPGPAGRSTAEQFGRLLLCVPYERLSLIKPILRDYSRMGLRLVPEFRFMMRHRIEDRLPKVTVPAMLVVGEMDWISPQRWIDHMATLLRTQRKATIPGAGHGVHYGSPEAVTEAIRPFLKEPRG